MDSTEHEDTWEFEAELIKPGSAGGGLSKDMRNGHCRTAHNMSSSSLRKKSDLSLLSKIQCGIFRNFMSNLHEIFLGTKLFVLFPAVPLAIAAQNYGFGRAWVFTLSLLGLTPLAERVSFLTEQLAFYTGPTVGGLLNATCGNATELIIALFALHKGKIEVKQANVNTSLLMLGALCHMLPLLFRYAVNSGEHHVSTVPTLALSRICSIVMLATYVAYLFFQLKTHRQLFESPEVDDDNDDVVSEDETVMGFPSALAWLVGMTIVIAILSEYVVGTIEAASDSWGISISFLSIILLPIVGNAAEHAGAIIFALKNKLDITLGVSLGSATQISMFVVPLSVMVAWVMGIQLDLDFKLLETGVLVVSILMTSFALQDGSSHYLKGFVLLLAYVVIGACFFVLGTQPDQVNGGNVNTIPAI